MLTHLQIRDFAIVESVELEFASGFTVLTGETGAGKSILVDALLLAVGGRADSEAVRHGAERAEVAASFDLARNAAACAWLDEQSLEHEGDVHLRRVVATDGRSRAYINGRAVPVQSLRTLGEHLVDVHGQLEFQSLARRTYQRELLDDSGGLRAEAIEVREAFQAWRALDEERVAFEQLGRDRESRLDLLGHYVAELEALDAKPGEADALSEERRRMASLGRLVAGTAQAEALLAGDDGGATAALARAQTVLRQLATLDVALEPVGKLLDEAGIASREAASGLQRYMQSLEANPARQEWVEARLASLEAAARKHRVDTGDLPQLLSRLSQELETLRDGAMSLADLERRLGAALDRYEVAARRLSTARAAAARALDKSVTAVMQGLGMPGGMFAARVEAPEPLARSEHGADEVEFLVSANTGQPLRPLAKTASGGELSRISLALQVATLNVARLPCLVFDEVDAGVGGAVAEIVGRQLRSLAVSGQVLCVTHLAQVASQADSQVRVSKRTERGMTRTFIEPLEGDARIEEIARMLGGTKITERTREHAREMLDAGLRRPGPRAVTSASAGGGSSRARTGRAG